MAEPLFCTSIANDGVKCVCSLDGMDSYVKIQGARVQVQCDADYNNRLSFPVIFNPNPVSDEDAPIVTQTAADRPTWQRADPVITDTSYTASPAGCKHRHSHPVGQTTGYSNLAPSAGGFPDVHDSDAEECVSSNLFAHKVEAPTPLIGVSYYFGGIGQACLAWSEWSTPVTYFDTSGSAEMVFTDLFGLVPTFPNLKNLLLRPT